VGGIIGGAIYRFCDCNGYDKNKLINQEAVSKEKERMSDEIKKYFTNEKLEEIAKAAFESSSSDCKDLLDAEVRKQVKSFTISDTTNAEVEKEFNQKKDKFQEELESNISHQFKSQCTELIQKLKIQKDKEDKGGKTDEEQANNEMQNNVQIKGMATADKIQNDIATYQSSILSKAAKNEEKSLNPLWHAINAKVKELYSHETETKQNL
jgi:hypothetical protein